MFRTCCVAVVLLQFVLTSCASAEVSSVEVKTNVCNMSLSAEGEADERERQVKCVCDAVSASCNDLGITSLPPLISFPKTILRASFSGNHLTDITDDTFYSGREIIEIDLSHNRIDFISVRAFTPFKKLQRLTASHNRLYNLPALAFEGLSELRMLDLSFNEINGLFYDAFEKLIALEELRLKGNPINELEPQHLSPLKNLKVLDLDAIMLSEVPDHLFVYATKLKTLSLANNLLTEIPTTALKPLKALKHLDLSGNPIVTIEPQAFLGLESLQVLYLDRMPELEEIKEFAFGDLKRLMELHCSYNFKLSDIDRNAFVEQSTGNLATVDQLFLRENSLEGLPAGLLRWAKTMEVDLRGNPWHCNCHTQWIVYVKTKTEFQNHLKCSSPASLQGQKVSNLKNKELPCGLTVLEIAFLSGLSLLAVTLLFTLVGFFMHRRRYRTSTEPYYKVFRKTGVDEVEYEKAFDS